MKKLNICILGGTGFVGHSIAAHLSKAGHQVRIISRRRERHRDLLVLPTVHVVQDDVHNPAVLRSEFKDMNAVINLVGILNERGFRGKGFEHVHTDLPAKVIQACQANGIRRLLHMSALNAAAGAPSYYLRSKAYGEAHVLQAGKKEMDVTVFRPSVIFGPKDGFINLFASLLRMAPFFLPLACPNARFQPVYVEDVAQAFVRSLSDHQTFGKAYDLCGPKTYTLIEIVHYIAAQLGVKKRIIGLGPRLSRLQAEVLQFAPGKPFSVDNFRSLQVDSVCAGTAFPAVFGITPAPLEDVVPRYLGGSS